MSSYPFGQFGETAPGTNPGDGSTGGSAGPAQPIDSFSTPTSPENAFPMWDSMDHQEEFQQQRQHQLEAIQVPELVHRPSTQQVYPQHQTIQIDDAPPPPIVVPSHSRSHSSQHDNTPVRLHHVHRPAGAALTSGRSQDQYRLDRSISPTLAGPSTSLVSRTSRLHSHTQMQHPYRRPQSAAPGTANIGSRRSVSLTTQIPLQQSRQKFSSNIGHSSALPSPGLPSPASAPARISGFSNSAMSSPVFNTNVPLSTMYPPMRGHHTASHIRGASSSTIATYGHPISATSVDSGAQAGNIASTEHQSRGKVRTVSTDTIYNPIRNVLTSILELPGVDRDDINITLSTSKFNRTRQIVVSGRARDLVAQIIQQDLADAMTEFGEQQPESISAVGHSGTRVLGQGQGRSAALSPDDINMDQSGGRGLSLFGYDSFGIFRQRKFGEFCRTIIVPHDTKPKDVHAHLQDGILIIKIYFGNPADTEDLHQVPLH